MLKSKWARQVKATNRTNLELKHSLYGRGIKETGRYQSHQSGIETQLCRFWARRLLTTNRTNLELKPAIAL